MSSSRHALFRRLVVVRAVMITASLTAALFSSTSASADAGAPSACSAPDFAACAGLSAGAYCSFGDESFAKCSPAECEQGDAGADAATDVTAPTLRCVPALVCASADVQDCSGKARGDICRSGHRCTELSVCLERDAGAIGERAALVCTPGFHISDLGDDQVRHDDSSRPPQSDDDSGCLVSPRRGSSTALAPCAALALGVLFAARAVRRRSR